MGKPWLEQRNFKVSDHAFYHVFTLMQMHITYFKIICTKHGNVLKSVLVSGRKRSRRGSPTMTAYDVDRTWSFSSYKCFFTDCIPPPDPDTIPPATERPLQYQNWEDTTLWNMTDDGYMTNVGGSNGVPQDFDDVKIIYGTFHCFHNNKILFSQALKYVMTIVMQDAQISMNMHLSYIQEYKQSLKTCHK